MTLAELKQFAEDEASRIGQGRPARSDHRNLVDAIRNTVDTHRPAAAGAQIHVITGSRLSARSVSDAWSRAAAEYHDAMLAFMFSPFGCRR